MEDTKKETTNLVENDIVEKKESLAVENEKNTDLAESKSDNVKKTSDPSDKSRKETSSEVVKSTKLSKSTRISMFSATLPKKIVDLAIKYQKKPLKIILSFE